MSGRCIQLTMTGSSAFARISAYMAENRLKATLEVDTLQKVAAESAIVKKI